MSAAALRQRIAEMRLHADAVPQVVQKLMGGPGVQQLVLRCDTVGRHKGKRKLAEIYLGEDVGLFISRIDWLVSDVLTLPPWQVHERLALIPEEALHDDEVLQAYAQRLAELQVGVPSDGPRWLASQPSFLLRSVLDPYCRPVPGAPDLWVRCSDHPAEACAVDPVDIRATHHVGATHATVRRRTL